MTVQMQPCKQSKANLLSMTTLANEFKEVESLFRASPVVNAKLFKVLVRFSRVTSW